MPSENEGETTFEISFPCENDLRESIFYAFADNRCPIIEMHSVSSSLEDIYLRMTSEEQLDLEETEETVEVEEMQTAVEDSQETVEEAEQTEEEENADVGNI